MKSVPPGTPPDHAFLRAHQSLIDKITGGSRFGRRFKGVALFSGRWWRTAAAPAPSRVLLTSLEVLGAIASVAQILAMAAPMAGIDIGELDRQTLLDLIGGSAVSYAWLSRIGALIVLGLVAITPLRWPVAMRVTTCLASGTATATLAWTRHGAMAEGSIGCFILDPTSCICSSPERGLAHLFRCSCWCAPPWRQ